MSDQPRKKRVRRVLRSNRCKSQNGENSRPPTRRRSKKIPVVTKMRKDMPTTSRQTRRSPRKSPNKTRQSKLLSSQPPSENEVPRYRNLTHYLYTPTSTFLYQGTSSQLISGPLVRHWSNLVPSTANYRGSSTSQFKRIMSAIACHPTSPNFIAAGTKGGELMLYNMKKNGNIGCFSAPSVSSSITALQFHPHRQSSIYLAVVHGRVIYQDFHGCERILLNTCCWANWFCSLKFVPEQNLLLTGDSEGNLYMVSENEENVLLKTEIHQSKVTSIDFCPKAPQQFVTSSTDGMVKLWDIRMLSKEPQPLHSFVHNIGVNSACFSPSSSALLTTDQRSQFKVFSGPCWNLDATIPHPNQKSQCYIPVKASWHPLFDAIVVGSYSEKDTFNSHQKIYFLDGHSGKELCTLHSTRTMPFPMLNVFNCSGDTMVTGSGNFVTFWGTKEEKSEGQRLKIRKIPKMFRFKRETIRFSRHGK